MKRATFLLAILITVHIILLFPKGAEAVGIPFGGRIVMTIPCLCSANFLFFVRDPRGFILPLIYQPGISIIKANYRIYPPVNTRGLYTPPGLCLILATPCVPIPAIGTIIIYGSSKI